MLSTDRRAASVTVETTHVRSPRSKDGMNDTDLFYRRFIEPIEDCMIRSVWRVTRDADDADDAMQNALIAIWRRRGRIAAHASPQALVLRICIDAACDVARRRSRERRRVEPRESIEGVRPPWEELAHRELSGEVLAAIHRLSRRQAVAITLRVFEELPYEQIAAAMRCSEATARKHVERARGHLRRVLARHEPHPITRSRS
jgi:RNA polymerase sigma-70 factor, ECF subfamily